MLAEAAAEFAASGAKIAVICSTDKQYATVVAELAPKLKAAGARTVILAGHPGASPRRPTAPPASTASSSSDAMSSTPCGPSFVRKKRCHEQHPQLRGNSVRAEALPRPSLSSGETMPSTPRRSRLPT